MSCASAKHITEFTKILCFPLDGHNSRSELLAFSPSGFWTNIGEGFSNLIFNVYHPTIDTYKLPHPHIAKKLDHATPKPFSLALYKSHVDR